MAEMDFTELDSRDTYGLYFNHLSEVFSRLTSWYRDKASDGDREATIVGNALERLLYTVGALRLKYSHHPSHSLKVDVTDSGFPSSLEVMALATDVERRDKALREMPPESVLKRQMLDFMFEARQEPSHLLWRLCERRYLELLDEKRLFLTFWPGRLERLHGPRGDQAARTYGLSWACYDYATSRPYVHRMTFTHDRGEGPLETTRAIRDEVMRVVEQEGSRAPDVGVLALAIDAALESIHPKIVKRICIGPLYSRFLSTHQAGADDELGRELVRLLSAYGRREDDFVLFFDHEVVFSKRQQAATAPAGGERSVREVFHIPADPVCRQRRASAVHRHVLMPHHLMQHVQDESIPALRSCKKLTYTENGEFHGIAS